MKLAPLALVVPCLALAAPAAAKPSFTPPASAGASATIRCVAQNVGTKPRTVAIAIRDQEGVELAAIPEVALAPGAVTSPLSAVGPQTNLTCVFDRLSRTTRGFVAVIEGGTTQVVVPAAR